MERDEKISVDGQWHLILPAFGIGQEFLKNRHGPCPGCGGKDRFRYDDKDGRGTWFCGGGGNPESGDGYALIAHVNGWDNKRAFYEVQLWLKDGKYGSGHAEPNHSEYQQTRSDAGISDIPARVASRTQEYALRLWRESIEGVGFHPYARAKGIAWEAGARRHKRVSGRIIGKNTDCILVPIRDLSSGRVVAVQTINPEGKKQTFGPVTGHGLALGNTKNKSIPWYVVEGWADAVSMVFHHHEGDAVAFAAFGLNNMERLAHRVAEIHAPDQIVILEDAKEDAA